MKITTAASLIFLSFSLVAQEKDYGRVDTSIPQLSEFGGYRGEWKAEMEMKLEDGSFRKIETEMKIIGNFLDDQRTYQSQFTTSRGFFSTDIRTFNTTTKKWDALFLNAKSQRWHHFTSELIDGKMVTLVLGGYSGKEDFDVKIIDTKISASEYLKHVYHSTDSQKTWKMKYRTKVTKVN